MEHVCCTRKCQPTRLSAVPILHVQLRARSAGQCVSRCRVASCRVFLVTLKVQPSRNAVMSPRSVHARVGLSRRARHFTRSTQNVHAAAHAGLARPTGASVDSCACSKPAPLRALQSDAARPLRRTRSSRLTFTTRYALTAHRNGAGCCARGKSRARACGLAYRAVGGSASLKALCRPGEQMRRGWSGSASAFSDRTAPHRTADRYWLKVVVVRATRHGLRL